MKGRSLARPRPGCQIHSCDGLTSDPVTRANHDVIVARRMIPSVSVWPARNLQETIALSASVGLKRRKM